MSTDFRLTEEEINKTVLRSPYSLADSPAQRGLGAGQIKKYFYDFIRYFAQCLNLHLGDITESTQALEEVCGELSLEATSHNASLSAHPHLRLQIEEAKNRANDAYNLANSIDLSPLATKEELEAASTTSSEAHEEIKTLIELVQGTADAAYNLARGRTKVHVATDLKSHIIGLLNYGEVEGYTEGDILLSAEGGVPDFIVFTGLGGTDCVKITDANALPELEVGKTYQVGDYLIIAIESGIDTSLLATKEELSTKETELLAAIDKKQNKLENTPSTLIGVNAIGEIYNYKIAQDIPGVESESGAIVDIQILAAALSAKTGELKLIKEYVVPETDENGEALDVFAVELEFDKPINEMYFCFSGGFNVEETKSLALLARTDGGSQYFVYKTMSSVSNEKEYDYCFYAKEMAERYWATLLNTLLLTGNLQGISASSSTPTLSNSYRKEPLSRYVNSIEFIVGGGAGTFKPGSTIKIYGREITE